MPNRFWSLLVVLVVSSALVGCRGGATGDQPSSGGSSTHAASQPDEGSIRANLNKLSPEDLKLAEEQRMCAVQSENRLGSMGVPYKVTIKDQPVFLCCDSCETKAKAHADRTLARVQQLKEKKGSTPQ